LWRISGVTEIFANGGSMTELRGFSFPRGRGLHSKEDLLLLSKGIKFTHIVKKAEVLKSDVTNVVLTHDLSFLMEHSQRSHVVGSRLSIWSARRHITRRLCNKKKKS
jgi:hypothetical protein